jgi:hypothetical protein
MSERANREPEVHVAGLVVHAYPDAVPRVARAVRAHPRADGPPSTRRAATASSS